MTRKPKPPPFTPNFSLLQAMTDPDLFGRTFRRRSFWTWRVLARLIDGAPLDEEREVELYRECTGRNELPRGPVRRLICLVGRRGGKDRAFSAAAVWRCVCTDWSKHISAGEQAVVILLGKDKKQAAILQRYCRGLIKASPVISAMVTRDGDGAIEFSNGSVLEIVTNDANLVRGRSAIGIFGSEFAHWNTDEASASSDAEVIAAARPSMAMCPDGGLMAFFSSVHLKRGYMHAQFEANFGNDAARNFVWFAPTRTMNPLVRQELIDEAIAEDGPRFRAEYLNIFRDSVSDFCPMELIERITDDDVVERPPERGRLYAAFLDQALGTGKDSAALAIGYVDNDRAQSLVVSLVLEQKPPFTPAALIAGWALVLKSYGIHEVYGDRVGGAFHTTEWGRNAITYNPGNGWKLTTSEVYLHALPLLASGRPRLNDCGTFRSQVTALERKVSPSGHETVQHPSNMHDDVAVATCGLLVLLSMQPRTDWVAIAAQVVAAPVYRPENAASILRLGGERAMAQQARARDQYFGNIR